VSKLTSVVLGGVLSVASLNFVWADQPEPDWIPAQQVIERAFTSGHTMVAELRADDGRSEGEGIKTGQKMEFHANPKTGVNTSEKFDDKRLIVDRCISPARRPILRGFGKGETTGRWHRRHDTRRHKTKPIVRRKSVVQD
jgi:hypothetical protein